MTQELITLPSQQTSLTALEMRAQVQLIQEVMQAVMIGPSAANPEGVHYGIIPGTKKNTLLKAGAEKLAQTFRIAPRYDVTDLSDGDHAHYRITCTGTHGPTGIVLGAGLGECSSLEEKYKWARTYSAAEFNTAPENRRRIKWYSKKGGADYAVSQLRTEAADVSNTVLKMASKRALVAMILTVTAASDIFTQDLDDYTVEERDKIRKDDDAMEKRESGRDKDAGKQTTTVAQILEEYPHEAFKSKLPKYLAKIHSGEKTADELIAWLNTHGILTEAQMKLLRTPAAKAESKPTKQTKPIKQTAGEKPNITYAYVADQIAAASTLDMLIEVADVMGEVADATQRAELVTIYKAKYATIEKGTK